MIKVNASDIELRELYSPKNLGVLHLPGVLLRESLKELSNLCLLLDKELEKTPGMEGIVRQESFTRYVGFAYGETRDIVDEKYAILKSLCLEYTSQVYNRCAELAGFEKEQMMNSIGIHKYPADNGGIEYHRDYRKDLNLVGVFSIIGTAKFSVAKSRFGHGEASYTVKPGDLMLMRHHRNLAEADNRPFHKVQTIGEDRHSIIFRQRNDDI